MDFRMNRKWSFLKNRCFPSTLQKWSFSLSFLVFIFIVVSSSAPTPDLHHHQPLRLSQQPYRPHVTTTPTTSLSTTTIFTVSRQHPPHLSGCQWPPSSPCVAMSRRRWQPYHCTTSVNHHHHHLPSPHHDDAHHHTGTGISVNHHRHQLLSPRLNPTTALSTTTTTFHRHVMTTPTSATPLRHLCHRVTTHHQQQPPPSTATMTTQRLPTVNVASTTTGPLAPPWHHHLLVATSPRRHHQHCNGRQRLAEYV